MKSSRSALRIVGRQWLHAGIIFLFPTASVAVAIWQATHGYIDAWMPILAVSVYVATMLGITVGFHRLLAHRAFAAPAPVVGVLAILGSMAAQGAPIYWVSNHRRHHRFSDAAGDPHSPHFGDDHALAGLSGFFHAHIGWMFTHQLTSSVEFSRDLLQNSVIGNINRRYWLWVMIGLTIPSAIGFSIDHTVNGALNGLLWGAGVRLFISYHLTSSINSITHLFGYRTFATDERSRNNLWLGYPTLGEAWHNNHHAFPASAKFGLQWWELDVGWWLVRLLNLFGLATNVRTPASFASAAAARSGAGEVANQSESGG